MEDCGLTVQTKELLDVDNPIYQSLDSSQLSATQKQAALARAEYDRACEGEKAAKADMEMFLRFLKTKQQELDDRIKTEPHGAEETGERHLLCVRKLYFEAVHARCDWDFKKCINTNKLGLAYKLSDLSSEVVFDLHDEILEEIELEEPVEDFDLQEVWGDIKGEDLDLQEALEEIESE